jgi:2-iminobutanoate/2-iminopropanoate deaminase
MTTERREIRLVGGHEPISHYTDGVVCGDLVFVSGCTAADADLNIVGGDDVAAQARQVLTTIGDILSAAGSSFADVLKVTVYLTDIDDRPTINPVRQEFFGNARPASTLVEISRLAIPGAKVEIDAVARVSKPTP